MKYIIVLLYFSSFAYADSDSLMRDALKLKEKQYKQEIEMKKALAKINNDIKTLRDSNGCLILDQACAKRKHNEAMKKLKAKRTN